MFNADRIKQYKARIEGNNSKWLLHLTKSVVFLFIKRLERDPKLKCVNFDMDELNIQKNAYEPEHISGVIKFPT